MSLLTFSPLPSLGSHLAFSCHVSSVSFNREQFLTLFIFQDNEFLKGTGWVFCRFVGFLNLTAKCPWGPKISWHWGSKQVDGHRGQRKGLIQRLMVFLSLHCCISHRATDVAVPPWRWMVLKMLRSLRGKRLLERETRLWVNLAVLGVRGGF